MNTRVEVLVKANSSDGARARAQYDVITCQLSGHKWGKGDLTGRFVLCTEIDLPCMETGKDVLQCHKCTHMGIAWPTASPAIGDTATPKATCELQKYQSPNATFTLSLDIHGMPYAASALIEKSAYKADLSKTALDQKTLEAISADKEMISGEELAHRLENARKYPVNKSALMLKA